MYSDLLIVAEHAARTAGQEIHKRFYDISTPVEKGFREWVTEGDLVSQEIALEIIKKSYPDHLIFAEESTTNVISDDGSWHIPEEITWFVDPIDGTTNFARHLPFFNVSIGVAIKGVPVVGVIFDPVHNHLFSATKGGGAKLDGHKIQVSNQTQFSEAIIVFDSPRSSKLRDEQMLQVRRLSSKCRTLRKMGSAALSIAYVATGWFDAYIHLDIQPWDVAVGALLIEEAGGKICQTNGLPWKLGNPTLVISNYHLNTTIVEVMNSPLGIE